MATNKYFNHTTNVPEQGLFESLVTEAIKIHGTDVLYIKRDIPELDEILREPKFSKFKDTHVIEMYAPDGGISTNNNFSMSKFGWLVDNTLELVVSMPVWEEIITVRDNGLNRPREGDLVFIGDSQMLSNSYINTVYEITSVKVGNEDRFQFGKNYVYTLGCQVYSTSHDDFETDNTDFNDFLNDNEHNTAINDALTQEMNDVIVTGQNPFGEL